VSRKDQIVKTIQEFHFWNYGMDDVSSAIEEDLEAQEWIPALADAILKAIDTAFVCAHCGGKVRDNWASSGALYWHVNRPECRAAFKLVMGKEPDGYQGQE
jgi:hypothetical protein